MTRTPPPVLNAAKAPKSSIPSRVHLNTDPVELLHNNSNNSSDNDIPARLPPRPRPAYPDRITLPGISSSSEKNAANPGERLDKNYAFFIGNDKNKEKIRKENEKNDENNENIKPKRKTQTTRASARIAACDAVPTATTTVAAAATAAPETRAGKTGKRADPCLGYLKASLIGMRTGQYFDMVKCGVRYYIYNSNYVCEPW